MGNQPCGGAGEELEGRGELGTGGRVGWRGCIRSWGRERSVGDYRGVPQPVPDGVVREEGHAGIGKHAPQRGGEAAVEICETGAGSYSLEG